MDKPLQLLEHTAAKTALIWYNDGSAIYVYDVNEMQSQMVQLHHAPFDRLVAFLKSTMLYFHHALTAAPAVSTFPGRRYMSI